MLRSVLVVAAVAVVALAPSASAQGFEGITDQRYMYNRGGYYTYADPGDITISVGVWGNVRYPGHYELRTGTTLSELISYCGSSEEATLLSSRRERQTVVRLSRQDASGGRFVVFERDLRELVFASDIPTVQDEDVLLIDVIERERFNWRDALPIASVSFTAANLILTIIRISQD